MFRINVDPATRLRTGVSAVVLSVAGLMVAGCANHTAKNETTTCYSGLIEDGGGVQQAAVDTLEHHGYDIGKLDNFSNTVSDINSALEQQNGKQLVYPKQAFTICVTGNEVSQPIHMSSGH